VKAIADEMSDRDAEIQDLRKQLAKKLSVQNLYLKQMLNRYNGK
jgi:mannitol/fructose-specific phosphotransferase system IIA component